ncbi:MAG: hypothetical protein JWN25_423, partial [Verrucomicrobiales bacterium]|nr:hypothetical protein [Verrucomicrobiales bacterium]
MYFCPEDSRNGFKYPLASRRQFISQLGLGMGVLGMASLFADDALAETAISSNPLLPKKPHFPAKAKHVVHIFAQGAPSQVDTWDPKPSLIQYNGKTLPGMNGLGMASPFKFTKRGKSGIEVSEVFSALGEHVDDLAIIRSMYTDIPAHEPGTVMLNTGTARFSRPSLGSWAVYGLGTENQNMPGFISLRPNGGMPPGGTQNWQSAFLPGVFQGTSINTQGTSVVEMIQNIRSPFSSDGEQRRQLDLVQDLNRRQSDQMQHNPLLEAKIEAAEIAFKMQSAATDAFDLSKEPQSIKDLYGTSSQGRQLLLARRLIERGVRFVQVWAGGWDHHNDLQARLTKSAAEIDKPMAAFITDLKQRGLLDSTVVIWGGEFGR